MSSSGQPENNGLSRRQGFEARVRHPARGASLWKLLRAARRDRLGLSGSQRHVLAAIQDDLQADTDLAAAFSAFTSATVGAAMPKTERLLAWSRLTDWRRCCRAFLNRRIMLVVAVLVPFAALVALAVAESSPGAQQARCEPAYAFAPACHGPSWTPAGVQRQGSTLPPAYSYGHP
jgi:hypothetical protein